MTDAECAETLAEFRKLTLGPELSAALDHAIARLIGLDAACSGPSATLPAGFVYPLTGSRAIDLAMA